MSILYWRLQKADPETGALLQAVYLGSGTKKQLYETMKGKRTGREGGKDMLLRLPL